LKELDMENYSILMGIYNGTNPDYLVKSIDSMLSQSMTTDDFVIVADGELTNELNDTLDSYLEKYPGLFKIVRLEKNVGLGKALQRGVTECKNSLIARMDDDDISYPNRCEIQLREFEKDASLDLVGGYIDEFYDDEMSVTRTREVPVEQEDIIKYSKRRSAFNHVTVMYRKETVIKSGNYSDYRLCQDVELWMRMMHNGAKMRNLAIPLVQVRFDKKNIQKKEKYS
jgi:glycosyltransferase involved in cell wall biosynthesis